MIDSPSWLNSEAARLIRKGVEEFNAGKFFECHDTLEEVWQGSRGTDREFLQGMIQISVGFYHFGNGNFIGAQSQLEKGLEKLSAYGDSYAGVELLRFRTEVAFWLERIRKREQVRCSLQDLPKILMK